MSEGPGPECPRCPRLVEFRRRHRHAEPLWHNAPVPSFGELTGRLLIVGLAPGLKGANRTGRPFTGDYAGDLLYTTLRKFEFATGTYAARADDGLKLIDCRITNAVRCVPPENKPEPKEIATCNSFLAGEIAAMPRLAAILALGAIAHGAVLSALGERKSARPFKHGAIHTLGTGALLADSYHCSRYNTNTGVLTTEMFEAVFVEIRQRLRGNG
ncbi:MAG TPA: uracil-DNA glycosylase [Stellaceae bacterium]|nr:uracil-DNA glycosylase [Stellaceae bacterium]